MSNPYDQSPFSDPARPVDTRPDYGADEVLGVERPRVGEAISVVPGVIVLDTSWSMERELTTVAAALDEFIVGLRRSPLVAAQAHMAIVTFADTARTALEFCQIADPSVRVGQLRPGGGGTSFRAAFDETYRVLREGLPDLAKGPDGGKRQVKRPTIYFISDGQPNIDADLWRQSLAQFDAHKWRPNRFAFGFGDADRSVIHEIADKDCGYFADDGKTPMRVIEQILGIVLRSMVTISQAANGGRTGTPPPDPGDGMVKIDDIDVNS
jgi:uncharacterized protein YegL